MAEEFEAGRRMPLSAIRVDTAPYERSHMKAPRGRGSWAFDLDGERRFAVPLFWHSGTYAEAVRAARLAAQKLGSCRVLVQP